MSPHLTRLVMRRILSNEPIVYRDCLFRRANAHVRPLVQAGRRGGYVQTRGFFNFLRPRDDQEKNTGLAPGLATLVALDRAKSQNLRPPDLETLCAAFCKLIQTKKMLGDTFSDVEAEHVLDALRYLDTQRAEGQLADDKSKGSFPSPRLLRDALDMLANKKSPRSKAHLDLAEEAFKILEATCPIQNGKPGIYNKDLFSALGKTVEAMSLNGEPMRSRDLLVDRYEKHGYGGEDGNVISKPLLAILDAFYAQDNTAEARRTLQMLRELGLPAEATKRIQDHLLKVHADLGDLKSAKKLYEEIADAHMGGPELSAAAYKAILKCCLEHNDREWGQSIVRAMLERLEKYYSHTANQHVDSAKEMWDSLFLWAAASGKGVDEVARMMKIMARKTFADGSSVRPDAETVNQLVRWCMSRNEPYFAERYITLGLDWGIRPNATTYSLQVMYRLSGGDIDGARAAYELLRVEDCSEGQNIRAANRLIQAMCAAQKYQFGAIMALVNDLNERKARFSPETVSALSVLHLNRRELHDAIDLLQTHAFRFTTKERRRIADTLVAMVTDREHTSTTRAWDTYIIAQSIFTELPRSARTAMMREFFARDRADMACHVFAHMRDLHDPNSKATDETYVEALTGIAEHAAARLSMLDTNIDAAEHGDVDEFSSLLDSVHNAMKLDLDVEPSTRLRNALMLAYTACGRPRRAWAFWEDVLNSREGPSFASIPIVLRVCERMAVDGERHARTLWARIRNMDVEVTRDMLAAYVGALAGNQNVSEAQQLLLGAEREFGWRPDAFMLGTLFNAAYGVTRQESVERWIQAKFPIQWVELQRLGARQMEDGPRLFNIDRRLKP